jgi:hypothetical protein
VWEIPPCREQRPLLALHVPVGFALAVIAGSRGDHTPIWWLSAIGEPNPAQVGEWITSASSAETSSCQAASIQALIPAHPQSAESALGARERSTPGLGPPVLARSPDVASTRGAAAPPAVALPVSDKTGHAGPCRGEQSGARNSPIAGRRDDVQIQRNT